MNRRGFFAMLGGLMAIPFLPKARKRRVARGNGVRYEIVINDTAWLPTNKEFYCYTAGNLDALGGKR